MFRRFTYLTLLFLALTFVGANVYAQDRQALQGSCERGGQVVTTDGRPSTTKVQRSWPSCTVTVYDAGTTTLADIFTNSSGTPKANPFTADTDGYWSFFADPGRYDVRFSGAGITSPFTRSNLWVASGGGGGGLALPNEEIAFGTGSSVGSSSQLKYTTADGSVQVRPYGTGTANTGSLRLFELLANGTNYFGLKAADSISTTYDLVLPTDVPASGDSLTVANLSGSTITTEWTPTGTSLTDTFIGYGSASNTLTGTSTLTWNNSTRTMTATNASGPVAINLVGSSSGRVTVNSANHPGGTASGLTLPFVGGTQGGGPGVWWSDGTYGATNGFYLSNGFTFQGASSTHSPVKIRKSTGTSSDGSLIFGLYPDQGAFELTPFGTSAGETSSVNFRELLANGTNSFNMRGPDSLSSSFMLVWPSDTPSAGEGLKVTSYNGGTGVITTEWDTFGGSSTCPPGTSTSKQVLYNLSGSCTGAVEFEYQQSASPNVYIRAQDPTYTALQLRYDTGSQSADIFQVLDESAAVEFGITASGTPYTPTLNGAQTGMRAGNGAFANLTGAAYGDSSNSTLRSVAVGDSANASSVEAIAIGSSAGANHSQSVCIGYDCSTFSTNQFIVGSRQAQANNVFFGAGGDETVSGTSAITINGSKPNNNNYPGGDIILASGLNRGTGVGTSSANSQASVRLQTSTLDGTSGSSQGSLVDRYIANGLKKIITTNNTATSLFEVALPTLRGASGVVYIEVHVEDGTDVQELYQEVSFAVINKGGTYTKTVNAEHSRTALSAGTLSATASFLDGTNKLTFQVTPNSSLTFSAARYWISYTLVHNSEQAITQL